MYAGSNKPHFVERDFIRKKQLLQALPLIERRLRPQIRCARQNTLRERENPFYVEFPVIEEGCSPSDR